MNEELFKLGPRWYESHGLLDRSILLRPLSL